MLYSLTGIYHYEEVEQGGHEYSKQCTYNYRAEKRMKGNQEQRDKDYESHAKKRKQKPKQYITSMRNHNPHYLLSLVL